MSDVPAESAASSRIAQALRDDILNGSIAPGQRLRQEDIAERLGGSRLPVREALRILAAEGLVQVEPNKGARVPLLDPGEVETLYRMRERLEPLALSESMANLSSADLAEISDIQRRIEQGVDVTEFLILDREFHMASYTGCTDEHLMLSVVRLWNSTQHYRRAFMSLTGSGRAQIVNAEHRLLMEAMDRRDTEDAELYLLGHIRRTRKELVRHPEIFSTGS
jgi:DNA-binding GntR family transcriptional regulator